LGGQTLVLTDLPDFAGILALPADDPVVAEIQDRNWNIFEATTLLGITTVWADILNGGLSTTLADLSVHLNQAPTGFASAALAPVPQDGSCTLAAATQLAGFSDADGDTLSVTGLVADQAQVTANGDGSFTLVPTAGYAGPVELSYDVVDGQGGVQAATQLFVVQPAAPVDHEATGTPTLEGSVREGATVSAGTSGISDADGPVSTTFQWQHNSGGGWTDIAGATGAAFAIPDDQSLVGLQLRVQATTTDPLGGSTGFTSAAQTVANVNDAPTGSVSIGGTVAAGQTLSAQHTLADADGLGSIAWQWQADGVNLATGPTLTLTAAQAGQSITLLARYTDAQGTPEQVASAAVGFGFTLTGTKKDNTLTGSAWGDELRGGSGDDTLLGLAGDDTLAGGPGTDVLTGGLGADRFVFDAALKKNLDRIADFDHAADTLVLDRSIFSGFTSAGAISAAQLAIGPAATQPTQLLVYNDQTGTLSYDPDGSGPHNATAFATLTGLPTLDWTDFIIG
jgi:Ca2+-binding RTX toxin-like protein